MIAAGLLGLGCALPRQAVATADGHGPAVESQAERAMFTAGGSARRLAEGETLEALMTAASRQALEQAGLRPDQVDRLYGYALLGEHLAPNGLFAVHRDLGLPRATWVVPVATDFTNFLSSLALAREAVAAGAARFVLVCCGASLSRHVAPGSGYGVSIGDAAAAALVGPAERDLILDTAFDVESDLLGAATIDVALESGGDGDGRAAARFGLSAELLPRLHDHGLTRPVALVESLLRKHRVAPAEVTLIAHQPTRVLMDHWRRALSVAAVLDTYDTLGNATAASVPATLALRRHDLRTPFAVLMQPGPGMHAVATLLRITPPR